ncbi:hypothetical protein PR048_022610 [Dryococelus australis]|uniref:E3 ubiquitin-protein ligase n=1 Tax=Dryococelus australis TaxID=614101 RepID=A0ABQ9H1G4_9NEOP|nr:hypothetical protein PR048_022610 [Dryococelus australis]
MHNLSHDVGKNDIRCNCVCAVPAIASILGVGSEGERECCGRIRLLDGEHGWSLAGWWQYDERTSRELEAAYKRGERHCELLIAGFLYVANFDAMLQLRRNDPSRRRRIKRDLATIPKKGVAGLRLAGEGSPMGAPALDLATSQLCALSLHDSSSDDDDEAPPPLAPWMVPLSSSSSSDEDRL